MEENFPKTVVLEMSLKVSRSRLDNEWQEHWSNNKAVQIKAGV